MTFLLAILLHVGFAPSIQDGGNAVPSGYCETDDPNSCRHR